MIQARLTGILTGRRHGRVVLDATAISTAPGRYTCSITGRRCTQGCAARSSNDGTTGQDRRNAGTGLRLDTHPDSDGTAWYGRCQAQFFPWRYGLALQNRKEMAPRNHRGGPPHGAAGRPAGAAFSGRGSPRRSARTQNGGRRAHPCGSPPLRPRRTPGVVLRPGARRAAGRPDSDRRRPHRVARRSRARPRCSLRGGSRWNRARPQGHQPARQRSVRTGRNGQGRARSENRRGTRRRLAGGVVRPPWRGCVAAPICTRPRIRWPTATNNRTCRSRRPTPG